MRTLCIQNYFILFNILATLSQHLPRRRQQRQQIATIIVSATSVTTTTTATNTTAGTASNSAGGDAAAAVIATPKAKATATPRTTSASAFVDEVLPHNDSVATTILHAKAIDNNSSSSSMVHNKNDNSNNSSNNTADDFEQLVEHKLQEEALLAVGTAGTPGVAGASASLAKPERLLSRKRRYLIFPEGSSFQLVYDGIYGIVDYTNYLILGITVALAWELPSKPQGEVIEEIANRLRDGKLDRLDVRRRNDTTADITYVVDARKNQTQPMKQQFVQVAKSARPNYIQLMTPTSPATKKSDYKPQYHQYPQYPQYTYGGRLPAVFHAPMHHKYYYYKGSNKYDKSNNNNNNYKKYQVMQRPANSYYRPQPAVAPPIGGYYKEHPKDWRRKDNYYYMDSNKNASKNNHSQRFNLSTLKVNPFGKWAVQRQRPPFVYDYTPQMQAVTGQYPWWNLATRLSNSLRRKPIPSRRIDSSASSQPLQRQRQQKQENQQKQPARPQKQQQKQSTASGFYRQPAATARKHRIYPVFGKRSIADEPPTAPSPSPSTAAATHNNNINNNNDYSSSRANHTRQQSTTHRRHRRSGIVGPELSRMERIHIRHHRSTRQTLYEKIEKYLDKLGIQNSHHCILRALCETGQKSAERSPGTFVGEIMRAVFTMPEALNEDLQQNRIHYKDQRYDRANGFQGSCGTEYALCQQSLWKTQFVK